VRRQRIYGVEPPRAVVRLLELDPARLGLYGRLRLLWYLAVGGLLLRTRLLWYRLLDRDTPRQRLRIAEIKDLLQAHLTPESRILVGYFERRLYSRDLAPLPSFLEKMLFRTTPMLVVQPLSEQDVIESLRFASEHNLTVVPRGVSSSAFGGAIPTRNGLVLDFSRMNAIEQVDVQNQTVVIQSGVRWADLAARLKLYDLTTATNPTSRFSTIGGWAATGGLGLHGYKYGHFRDAVVALRIVLPTGETLSLNNDDNDFGLFIGTEGQLGLITQLTLKLRKQPAFSRPVLIKGVDAAGLTRLLQQFEEEKIHPSHVVFYSRARLAEENRLFIDRTGHVQPVAPEHDAVLLHFDDAEEFSHWEVWIAKQEIIATVEGPAARYLWAERYFPLQGQRLGPNLLAAELVGSPSFLSGFFGKAREIAARFGVELAVEAIVSRVDGESRCVVIASFAGDARRTFGYPLHLLLVQLMVRVGVRLGAAPYGIGIWNAAMIADHFSPEHLEVLQQAKRRYDPDELLNPNKFFEVRSRFANVPGLLFAPRTFGLLLDVAGVLAPVLGLFSRLLNGKPNHHWSVPDVEADDGFSLLTQTAQRCTHCGACIAICPAYRLTGDERVTGRAKLQLGDALLQGETIEAVEAFSPFQCIRCGLCEEVCQTRLPLRDCYDVMEKRITTRLGPWPEQQRDAFTELIDQNRDWIAVTFGLDLADWSPENMVASISPARNKLIGGGR